VNHISPDPNINDGIQVMIDHTINQIPKPMKVYITKNHNDGHVDVKTLNEDTIEYVPIIANNIAINNIGVLIFLENDEMIIISK
jgi:hypothetical protein